MSGLTPEGFDPKRLEDIIQDMNNEATSQFQDLVGDGDVVNTDPNSILGRQIGIHALPLADLWEVALALYNASNINAATGVALDNLTALGGVTRKASSASNAIVMLSGSVGTDVTSGSKVSSPTTGELFTISDDTALNATEAVGVSIDVLTIANSTDYTIQYVKVPDGAGEGIYTVTITSDADATKAEIQTAIIDEITASHTARITAEVVNDLIVITNADQFQKITFTTSANLGVTKSKKLSFAVCDTFGPISQEVNTITTIVTPILGWDSVTNPSAATEGTDRETDDELRLRYINTKSVDGTNTVEALYSALFDIDGVTAAVVIENDTDDAFVSAPLVPPHSFMPIVLGGSSQLIGEAIWKNKPVGILSFGDVSVTILDSQGIPHVVSFQRPANQTVYIDLEITVLDDFDPNGLSLIKQALLDYFDSNYSIGNDVIYSRLFTPINSVSGHYINSLTIGFAPSPVGTSNLTIDYDKIASLVADNIVITQV